MVDADAPSAKAAKCRYWLHWATSDVDGRHLRNGVNWMNGEGKIIKGKIMISLVKQDLNIFRMKRFLHFVSFLTSNLKNRRFVTSHLEALSEEILIFTKVSRIFRTI